MVLWMGGQDDFDSLKFLNARVFISVHIFVLFVNPTEVLRREHLSAR